jgi:hypothetical protein
MEVASLPDEGKPEAGDEAMSMGSERVQRAVTDQPRNLGDPAGERRGSHAATASGNQ